jgi:hypothetical protein
VEEFCMIIVKDTTDKAGMQVKKRVPSAEGKLNGTIVF